jgi:predicted nucleic acid-binding protein
MARPRTELPFEIEAEIKTRTARNESARTIHQAIHGAISEPTIARRQRELRRPTSRGPVPNAEIVEVPENIPENTLLEQIERWLEIVERALKQAEADGNIAGIASLAMRANSLLEARRKAMPLPKADPNENPDMIKLGELAEKRLFALVDDLFRTDAP